MVPAGSPQQIVDKIEVLLHTTFAANDLGHSPRDPDLATEAERLSALSEQQRHAGQVLGCQPER